MVDAASVQKLNASIEKINVQRTKAETRIELLRKQMNDGLVSYQKQYGVALQGKDFNETKKNINEEVKKVVTKVQEEYDLKLKVVHAIESGDYSEAYRLLGIKIEEPAEEQAVGTGALSADALEDIEGLDDSGSLGGDFEFEDEDYEGTFEEVSEEGSFEEVSFGDGFGMEDEDESEEDEEETLDAGAFLNAVNAAKEEQASSKGIKGSSVAEAMESIDFGNFGVDDDDDDFGEVLPNADDDLGFGSILQGTKFQV